jgi:hypothetical protein
MVQLLTDISGFDSALLPPKEEVSTATAELSGLLSRRAEISSDIARIRKLLKRLTHNCDSHWLRGQSSEEYSSLGSSSSLDHRLYPSAKSTRRPQRANTHDTRVGHSKLERACRIALMETNEPASVETIYDRIQRRESHNFTGYKRPLRAIRLVMSAMVKRGEARLLNDAGLRRWHWVTERNTARTANPV